MAIAQIHAARVPAGEWHRACQAALETRQSGEAPERPTSMGDARWGGLVADFVGAPIWLHSVSTHAGLLFEASIAVSNPSTCVVERYLLAPQDDGTLRKGPRDPDVEVSVTTLHPWHLLRRALPPLELLRAPARQTPSGRIHPVRIDPTTQEAVLQAHRADPSQSLAAALRQAAPAGSPARALTEATSTAAYVVSTGTSEAALLGAGYYVASAEHLFRATFTADPVWEEVDAGDLAFSVEWHLLGARAHQPEAG